MVSRADYYELRRAVAAAGLLDRRLVLYAPAFVGVFLAGGAAAALLAWADGAARFLAAPCLSLFWIQIGFIGHECGHNQVSGRTGVNRAIGLACMPLLLGMGFRPWVIQHNRHHVETNVLGADPDIANELLAFTDEDARAVRGLRRWVVRRQAVLYPFLGLFATLAQRKAGWSYVLGIGPNPVAGERFAAERRLELFLLTFGTVGWLIFPSLILGAGTWLPVYLVAQLMLGAHMATVFAPNHKGMEQFSADRVPSFVDLQVRTSRNVVGGWLCDFFHGGLNYQIEHHLFPTMPRPYLGKARPMVRSFCAAHGLPYREDSFVESWREIFAELDRLGRLTATPAVAWSRSEDRAR
jgi:fatty acid desaturase